ncbi:lytic polysaccharide monooxygenase [Karstenula rhodostoma CBS 690.94]|uniref:Lytic polysaccharide monooxygenase n=1 Tax=Karstenula rhodostoma CBS 690.94 TaxID=1392251 RepID=A0A9P4PAC6_9PLEO|nr:lytic polysaccharide monooxygenase [Karstenula rhodostoma CBS 690.94]
MSFRSALFAASALIAATNAHITISNPVPYSADQVKIDKAAITADQFPCKSQYGFTVTQMNSMKVGEPQKLEFDGSAVHGGGSCQLSYTPDTEPTKDSVFKVIKSIEGGCPGVDGTKSFEYTLPDSIPNGKGTFVWSWFAKMSGAPEFYMNCAPIDVTGGASDASGLDALPDMFVANIASTTCTSPLNHAVKFPNPGENLEDGGTNDTEDPTGECGATGSTPAAPSAGAPAESAPVSAPVESAPVASATAAPVPTTLATIATQAPVASAPVASAPVASSPVSATIPSSTAPANPDSGSETGGSTGGSTGAAGTCSSEGAIVCNGADQFGICNGGSVVWQAVAPGTTCSNGNVQKRSMYYGRPALHARRV